MTASELAAQSETAFAQNGLIPKARILNDRRSVDLAFSLPRQCLLVLRCVERAQQRDYRALETMLRDGDFDRALLVHTGPATTPPPSSEIETCTLDQLPDILARWERSL